MIKKTGLLCSVLVCLLFLPAAPVTLLSQELGEWGSSWDDGDETGEFDGLGQYDEAGMSGGSAGTDFDERAGLYGYVESRAAVSFDRDTAGLGFSTRLRLKGEWKSSDVITARMEMGYNEDEGVLNSLTRALDLGIYPAVALQAENPQDSFFGRFEVDQAWGVVNLGCFDLSLGKMPIAWGNAWFYNPTNRLGEAAAPKGSLSETPGIAAFVPVWYPGGDWALEGTVVFRQRGVENTALTGSMDPGNIPLGLRVKGFGGGFDFTVSIMREVWYTGIPGGFDLTVDPPEAAEAWERTWYLGLDTIGQIGPVGLYLETSFAAPGEGNRIDFSVPWRPGQNLDLSAGIEYASGPWSLKGEYIHYSAGEGSMDDYRPDLLLAGRAYFLARNYLFLYASRRVGDFLEISSAGIVNLDDRSTVFSIEGNYPFLDNFEGTISFSLPFGPAGSEYRGEFDPGTGKEVDFMVPEVSLALRLSF